MLLNDEFVIRQARLFAKRVAEAEPKDTGLRSTLPIALPQDARPMHGTLAGGEVHCDPRPGGLRACAAESE